MQNNQKKIFILEDEVDLNEMIAIELDSRGYETNTFYNPKIFMKAFSEVSPDLLITDIRLPEISGIEIVKMVKETNIFTPPIITITAYNDIPAQTLYQLGVESVIYKPFQLNLLTSTIQRLCIPAEDRLQLGIDRQEQYLGWVRKIDDKKTEDINLGRGGFSFSIEEKIGNDEVIEFSLKINNRPEIILSGLGIVRWNIINLQNHKERIVNKYGVEFVYLEDKSKDSVLEFVYNNRVIPYIPF